jgi:hypothetical protein
MKKNICILLCSFVLLSGCSSKNKKTTNNVDRDIKELIGNNPNMNKGTGTFNIQATKGWTKVDTTISGMQIVLLKSEQEGSNDTFMENINVVTEKTKDITVDEYYKLSVNTLTEGMSGFVKTTSNKMTINGLDTYHLVYSHTYTGLPLDAEAYFLVHNGIGYVITCSTEKGKLQKWKTSFDEVVNTFVVN